MKLKLFVAIFLFGGFLFPSNAFGSNPIELDVKDQKQELKIASYFYAEGARPMLLVMTFYRTIKIGDANQSQYEDVCFINSKAKVCKDGLVGTARLVTGKVFPLDGKKLPKNLTVREVIYQESNYVNDQLNLTRHTDTAVKINEEGEFWDIHFIPTYAKLPADMQEILQQQIYVGNNMAIALYMTVDRNKYSSTIDTKKSWFNAPMYPYQAVAQEILAKL